MRTSIQIVAFLSLLMIIGGCAGSLTQKGTEDLPYRLHAQETRKNLSDGDELSITSVHGDSWEYRPGATYLVRGRYQLQSREEAYLTQWCANGWVQEVSGQDPESQHGGSLRVKRGEGEFTFRFRVREAGDLHLSFYPVAGGESFGSLYYVPMRP